MHTTLCVAITPNYTPQYTTNIHTLFFGKSQHTGKNGVVTSASGSSPRTTATPLEPEGDVEMGVPVGDPVVNGTVNGVVNGVVKGASSKALGGVETAGGGTMEMAKSDMARVWRSENRVGGIRGGVVVLEGVLWWHALQAYST